MRRLVISVFFLSILFLLSAAVAAQKIGEDYNVLTVTGKVVQGTVISADADKITVQVGEDKKVIVQRDDIEQIIPISPTKPKNNSRPMKEPEPQQTLPISVPARIPDGHVTIGSTLGGEYVITKPLKEKYDALRNRANLLKSRIANREIDEVKARRTLVELQAELQETLTVIQDTKQLVTAAQMHTTQQSIKVELGAERCLLIRAGRVRVVGWDKPHVECVLKKIVLSHDPSGVKEDFAGIRISHRHGIAPEDVGYTDQQYFDNMKGDNGELSDFAKSLADGNIRWHAPLRAMQGKPIDVIQIDGLTHQQGNRQISIEVRGNEGGSSSSQWRRHTSLTVYVPKCEVVGIRGGREGVVVEDLDASLAIMGDGDFDYDARSRITGIRGGLTAAHIPLHDVRKISGDVHVQQTMFKGNASTHHSNNARTTHSGTPHPMTYEDITGDLRLEFTRAELNIESVAGRIDVRNEFGDTNFVSNQPLVDAAHRFVSQSGRIKLKIPAKSTELSTTAFTECGVVSCENARRDVLETKNITTSTEPGPVRRNWKGFTSSGIQFFFLAQRIDHALSDKQALPDEQQQPRLDIISRAGQIDLVYSD